MSPSQDSSSHTPSRARRTAYAAAVLLLLALAAALSTHSLLGDSLTYDELDHLTGGISKLKTGDYRLAPGNPPLGQVWGALPLLFLKHEFPGPDADGWRDGRVWRIGHHWLYTLNSDAERLVSAARSMSVVTLLATCLCIFAAARALFGPAPGLLALALAALSPELKAHGRLVTADLPVTLCFTLVLITFARLVACVTLPRLLASGLSLAALALVKFSWPLVAPALIFMALHALLRKRPIKRAFWRTVDTITCTQSGCGHPNPDHLRFCELCGGEVSTPARDKLLAPFKSRDPGECACGHESPDDADFCEACGRPLFPDDDDLRPGVRNRAARLALLIASAIVLAALVYAGIWSAFLWRYSPFAGVERDQATMAAVSTQKNVSPRTMDEAWDAALRDPAGEPLNGAVANFIRWAKDRRFLPEAYLYGLALVLRPSENRNHYLNGEIYPEIRPAYFPIAFILKTPIATLLLLISGIAALCALWPIRSGQNLLARGMYVFIIVYSLYLMFNAVNIGHRHLLPIYPCLLVLASASACWFTPTPAGRPGTPPADPGTRTADAHAVPGASTVHFEPLLRGATAPVHPYLRVAGLGVTLASLLWLAWANISIHPNYLSYFNEFAGGPYNGWRFLADSNLDWGQDLKRLARYARLHPDEKIKLAYFGSAKPDKYGFEVENLGSSVQFSRPAKLEAGTYVLSITQALGIYAAQLRDSTWNNEKTLEAYRKAHDIFSRSPSASESDAVRQRRAQFDILRTARLISRLRTLTPDDRIGCSMWVFRLSQSDVDELTKP